MSTIPIDRLKLLRYPITKDSSLRAWNAADEYLVSYLQDFLKSNLKIERVLICNDQFGALTCSMSNYLVDFWTDSFLSKTAIEKNLLINKLEQKSCRHIADISTDENKTKYDLVVIRIPKHNSLLAYQLEKLKRLVHEHSLVLAAGMTKDIHKSNLSLFENILGPTKTSLAKKKARLIFSSIDTKLLGEKSQEIFESAYPIKQANITSFGLPGVFSRNSLDIGSRVLLEYLPNTKPNQKLVDLGCGTGVLGTIAKKQNSTLDIYFTDESFLAIRSAKITFERNTNSQANYYVTNVLDGLADNSFDHILCNPPFHQQNVQTLSIANQMFKQSAKKLRNGGELRVVANRHLKYRPLLNQYFSKTLILSNDPKFIVWLAIK